MKNFTTGKINLACCKVFAMLQTEDKNKIQTKIRGQKFKTREFVKK